MLKEHCAEPNERPDHYMGSRLLLGGKGAGGGKWAKNIKCENFPDHLLQQVSARVGPQTPYPCFLQVLVE